MFSSNLAIARDILANEQRAQAAQNAQLLKQDGRTEQSRAEQRTGMSFSTLLWCLLLAPRLGVAIGNNENPVSDQKEKDHLHEATIPVVNAAERNFTALLRGRRRRQTQELVENTTSLNECRVPQFTGDWMAGTKYRFPVAEAQGVMIGQTMVVVGGFLRRFKLVTRKTYSLDTSKRTAIWRERDPHPMRRGVTHAASALVGTKFYMCGGYLGGHPGPHTDRCFIFDLSQPRRKQWSPMASLPDGGRSGGGMFYDTKLNALFYAAGAQRHSGETIDFNNTWMYSLENTTTGWISKACVPFLGNHVSFVTAKDQCDKERHYILGGQRAEDEVSGNIAENFEYDAVNDVWIARESMPSPRGHTASSTRAVSCGYIVAAGTINGGHKESDVSYYDITTDTWTSIGSLPKAIKTPVCDLSDNTLYCESGFDNRRFSHKIHILV